MEYRDRLSLAAGRAVASLAVACIALAASAQGTWTKLNHVAPGSCETALLLTDGTVMVHSWDDYQNWFKLTPDASGSYVNGTWTSLANMITGRLYFPNATLQDGRIWVAGGEYLSNSGDHNAMEVYDPVKNTWTAGPDSPSQSVGDTGASLLPDNTVLASNWSNTQTNVWSPLTNSWTVSGNMFVDSGDEESWLPLPDGSIWNPFRVGQRYWYLTHSWYPTPKLPAVLVDGAFEIGPAIELYYNNLSMILGSTGHTVLYRWTPLMAGPGFYHTGADIPNGMISSDCPAAVEPNGKVLLVATPTDYGSTYFFEYDPTTNSFTSVQGPNVTLPVSYAMRFLNLPNGQILCTLADNDPWVYTPVGGPDDSWRSTVTNVSANGDGSYTLTGTQLNGLTNGSAYGDEADPFSNFPIVYLDNGAGHVYFCRTFNRNPLTITIGGTPMSTEFTLPASLPHGTYSLYVSANGVSSHAYSFTY